MIHAISPEAIDSPHRMPRRSVVETFAVHAICIVFAAVSSGLLLAFVGVFNGWAVLPAGLILGSAAARRWPEAGDRGNSASTVWWLAGAVAALAVVGHGFFPSEQYIGGRDGGTYLATAAWVSTQGDLLVDARPGPFSGVDELEFGGPGFYDSRDDGRLRPQFLHGFPVVAATARSIGGDAALLRTNAALGGVALLAVFGFARLLTGGWLALLVEATLATNLVFGFYARAPFSEVLAMALIFGGLWVMWEAFASGSSRGGALAGLVFGASLLTRIDSFVLLIPLAVFLAYEQRRAGSTPDDRAVARAVWRGLLSPLLLALVDLMIVTPDYLANQSSNVVPILVVLGVVVVGDAFAGDRIARAGSRMSAPARARSAWVIAGVVGAFAFFAYFVRPLIQEVSGSPYLRLAMDEAELAVGEGRLFSEDSARWLGWYLGPVAALSGLAGWALLTRRVLTGRNREALAFLGVFSSMALLYIWRPSINPDHIWAMRRFLPVVIPGLLILSALVARLLWSFPAARWLLYARAAAAVLAGSILGFGVVVSAPLAGLHEFHGLGSDLRAGCDLMGEDAAVVFVDNPGSAVGSRLASTYRSHCDLPTAYTDSADLAFVDPLSREWLVDGRRLWLMAVDPARLRSAGLDEIHEILVGRYEILELTFTRRPTQRTAFEVAVFAAEVPGHG